jgi:hypothetical protein
VLKPGQQAAGQRVGGERATVSVPVRHSCQHLLFGRRDLRGACPGPSRGKPCLVS